MATQVLTETLDPVAVAPREYTVLLENDVAIRVVEVHVPRGGNTPIHSHGSDYVVYALGASSARFHSPNGRREEVAIPAGAAEFRHAETHSAETTGSRGIDVVNIELKGAVPPGAKPRALKPDLREVAPQFCKLLLENNRCRLLEIRFPPGAALGTHDTPDAVVYPLADGTVRITDAAGESRQMAIQKGKPLFVKGGVYAVVNIGQGDMHVVKLDLKL